MYKKIICTVTFLAVMLFTFSSCGNTQKIVDDTSQNTQSTAQQAVTLSTNEDMFTSRDMEIGYDESTATVIALSGSTATVSGQNATAENGKVEITAAGTFVLRGSLAGQIVINAPNTDKIQIVLDGVELQNSQSPAIYVKQADKVFVTLATGTQNTVEVKGEYIADGDTNTDAAIFSKEDITFNGNGELSVTSETGNGITGKDDLVITSGTYTINAGGHGIEGKDSVRIANGTFTVVSVKDGIHAENADDTALGFVYIENGSFSINAEDDGIHAAANNTIAGGVIDITKSYEGIEGTSIDITGGTISLISQDDGLNAAGGVDGSGMGGKGKELAADANCYIKISGGTININASGDGIDSNGNLYVSGGETYVSGPENSGNGALDYNGTGEITGGIFVAADTGGMAMNFGSASTQGAMLVSAQGAQSGLISLKNSSDAIIASFQPTKQYAAVLISAPGIKTGEKYAVAMGEATQEIEMTDIIYGQSSGIGGGMRGGNRAGMQGTTPPEMPNGEMPQGKAGARLDPNAQQQDTISSTDTANVSA